MTEVDYVRINREVRRNLRLFVNALQRQIQDIFFVEIGAMDGVLYDHLHDHILNSTWRGLLVEPLPDMFARLQATYAQQLDRLTLEQVAIGNSKGVATMYRVDPEALDEETRWHEGLSSLYRDRNCLADLASGVIELKVPTETLPALLQRHRVDRIDIFQVDTEGHDLEVLKQLDFHRYEPLLVLFESCCLPEADLRMAKELLVDHGFFLFRNGPADVIASRFAPPPGTRELLP